MKAIDHLVYCVPNLDEGIRLIENKFGIAPTYGGRHLTQGTHNALLNLGNGCYLELLAIDPNNDEVKPPRWMGIDLVNESKLTRWALKTNNFEKDLRILKSAAPHLAKAFIGSRMTSKGSVLNWQMSLPLPEPEVELLPFILDWKDSVHPTKNLREVCQLKEFSGTHPDPSCFKMKIAPLDFDMKIEKSDKISLSAKIITPNGLITI